VTYQTFLEAKAAISQPTGFHVDPSELNAILKPHQADIVRWAVHGGRRAIFAAFGLGKSVMQLEIMRLIAERTDKPVLIVCPLGVRAEFIRDGRELLGVTAKFIRRAEEIDGAGIYLTNYETVRDGKLDPSLFEAASLDEASILRSYGSKTYQTFLPLFDKVRFRFVATATPSPNRYKELIHYAGFLGVMDTGQALTRFFQRDSTKANNLTLYPHKVKEFWLWLNTWAIFLQRPSDLCPCGCHGGARASSASGSVASSLSAGIAAPSETVRGSVAVTVGTSTSPRPTTSRPVESSVVDASDPSTAVRAAGHTTPGDQCSTVAHDRSTRTGPTTAAAESPSVHDGLTSPHSSQTWDSHLSVPVSTASTLTGTTSPTTAGGQQQPSRPTTAALVGSATCCRNCRCDDGYDLPDIEVVYHEVSVDMSSDAVDRDGQRHLFKNTQVGVADAAREKRQTLPARVERAAQLVDEAPGEHFILWHDLEDERRAIKQAMPDAGEVFGTLDLEIREQRIEDFANGRLRLLATKPELSGSGCNLQKHCHRAIFVGVTFSFNDLVQAIHRIHRYGQTSRVRVDIIHAESERSVVRALQTKWTQHKELTANMTAVIREHGLNRTSIAEALTRSIGVERLEASGEGWIVANNDTVPETASLDENSLDLIVTSIPFANHYEYTPSYNDFGHTDDNPHFWAQMDYLTPSLLRALKPGRIYACHVKDRINFGSVTGAGAPTVSPFHAEAIFHAKSHGFDYMGMVTVVTDVVRENNQTYRLGWSEMAKDGTKMGFGSPEYILIFRKPQTDRTRGYADEPVTHDKGEYTRARWQVDAHAFWRSSGDRLLTADELAALPVEQRSRLFTEQTLREVYDYETHIRIGEELEGKGALPATFMSLAPGSWHPEVWHDVNRMLTLNTEQSRRAQTMHVCPLQTDIVDRLIERYSNPGDLVYDPFAGLGTVPLIALRKGRRGRGVELNTGYWLDSVKYLEAESRKHEMPSLFDLDEIEAHEVAS
jgi:hypothetical protein